MEQIGLKNLSTVCENSLANEVVNQMSGNISIANFSKSTCRIKNGLINGVSEESCSTTKNYGTVPVITNRENANLEIPKDKHNQNLTHNCINNSICKTDLNHSEKDDESSSRNFLNNRTNKQHIYSSKHSESSLETDLTTNSDATICNTKELSLETKVDIIAAEPTLDVSESNKELLMDINKLTLTKSISDKIGESVKSDTNAAAIGNLELAIEDSCEITYVQYESELQMPLIMKIIQKDLSEPYSIYTYRYFIHNWPKLCFLAMCDEKCVGAIVCKLDYHRKSTKRGYIAMLAVDQHYRKRKIGSTLVRRAIREMIIGNADEVVLETEVTNKPALRLYELLGFVRDKRLFRYYLNGVDALRLKLWLR